MVSDELVVRVHRITREADGVVSLALKDPSDADLPEWAPGAHIDVHLPNDIVRQYSLCGDNADTRTWRIAILLEPESRGGSSYVHGCLEEGHELRVSLPRNHFPLTDAQEYFFVAGGIGVTPILAMTRAVGATRRWNMLYGGRSRASMAFVDELAQLDGKVSIQPQDEVGLLDLAEFLKDVTPGSAVYCCGPGPLIRAMEAIAEPWPPGTLHVERFHADTSPVGQGDDKQFVVELARARKEITVHPEETIIAALSKIGVRVTTSCEEGVCGTCETTVLGGEPDHRDSVLTDEERALNTTMMVCCSRSKTPRLVLDL